MLIQLPSPNSADTVQSIETNSQPLVIIGANGSGKTKLGYRIEQINEHSQEIVRISAHRALKVPENVPLLSLGQATNALKYGNVTERNPYYKHQNSPTIYLQDDYSYLLSSIFAQKNKRNEEYVEISRLNNSTLKSAIPDSSIDTIIKIWNSIYPHRGIEFKDNKVTAYLGQNIYEGKEMSDGERVSLYLIGYCLSAPINAIIVVDEPELHLHRALMSNLWNQIQTARQDCQFIYITHDLEFASTRTRAPKIWVKSFIGDGGGIWDWQLVPEVEEIPEELLLEIVGSRKPILFVEGEKGSYDYEIFQYIFPDFTIIPRKGNAQVIEATKALKNNPALHTIDAWGLIDRDYRTEEEISALRTHHIVVCDVTEVENLFLTPELITVVARHQGHSNPIEFINATTNFVITHLQRELEQEISYTTSLEVNYRLNAFDKKKVGLEHIKQALINLTTSIDVDSIYMKHRLLYQKIIDERDLKLALRHYKNKGLVSNMSNILKMGKGEYDKLIIRLLRTDVKAEIVTALRQYIPAIPSN